MAYEEWIELGRDPVWNFGELSREESRRFLRRVIDVTPERLRQLGILITERRPGSNWRPDFTEEAYRVANEVFKECVETRPRDSKDIERNRRERPEIFNVINEPVRDWEPTDRTLSIAYDMAIYFAQVLMSKESRLGWKVDTARTSITRNQPMLWAPNPRRKPPFLTCAPFHIYICGVLNVGNNSPPSVMKIDGKWTTITSVEGYRYWMQIIQEYKVANPL